MQRVKKFVPIQKTSSSANCFRGGRRQLGREGRTKEKRQTKENGLLKRHMTEEAPSDHIVRQELQVLILDLFGSSYLVTLYCFQMKVGIS